MILGPPYKVAIIDDDNFQRTQVAKLCAAHSWVTPVSFANPAEALNAIKEQWIRIVFLDINMPEKYGDEVLRECIDLHQGIQVYVVTGTGNMTIANRCLNLGARLIIPKPVTKEKINEALDDARVHLERSTLVLQEYASKRTGTGSGGGNFDI